ncbi:cupin [Pseudoalteromonas citrea]|uniref:Cupin n=1 Tax=Pseudoalteromonas citrea TaxID=43655 RepID=A0A5S3XU82_9GAMM|nr:cupin domain-containing protein [Pseudoalteromonas citrea]TMP44743.1 cupin [Pseudoalteromonas citrea]TMP61116.1 cupin [Pseudoalteromonas citrea]
MTQKINLAQKFLLFDEQWQPKVVAQMNDYQFKVVKVQGEFVWHQHDHTDETFIVVSGQLNIAFVDEVITLNSGEMIVVPKGVQHKPFAEKECQILIIEPQGVKNTGDAEDALTAKNDVWI